ncbi:MAG TPA: hypothetical protein VMA37_10290 [Acetobacteraceae bacterium]|nr:hypothetical protein [Acetobacteraceae bacterium]
MASARLVRLLSRLAARDLAMSERHAVEAAASFRSMVRNVNLLDSYTKELSASLFDNAWNGYDFAVAIGFRASGIKASNDAAAAMERGQNLQRLALDRLARELQRRDAITSATKAVEIDAERERARIEDRR